MRAQVSCYEIYNERVRDLAPQQQQSSVNTSSTPTAASTSTSTSTASLRVRESPVLGAFVEGLTRLPVQDMQQMAAVISSAIESRLVVLVAVMLVLVCMQCNLSMA
jgi:Kinesin motor domain